MPQQLRHCRKHRRLRRVRGQFEQLERRQLLTGFSLPSPTPRDDVYTLDDEGQLELPASVGVLMNDGVRIDQQGAQLVEGPTHGVLELGSDGGFRYTPNDTFEGLDDFTYRFADDSEGDVAVVRLGLAEALEDRIQFRLEITTVDGTPVTTASANSVLELRIFAVDVPEDTEVGVLMATVGLSVDGDATPEFQHPAFGTEQYVALSLPQPDVPGEISAIAALAIPRAGFTDGEQLLARQQFTVNDPGTLVLRAAPAIFERDAARQWHAHLGTSERLATSSSTVTHGEIDYGESVSVEIVDAGVTIPTAVDDRYSVSRGGTLEVSAADGLLANDTSSSGEPLAASLLQGPRHGELTLHEDGSFTYAQTFHTGGTDRFYYTVHDGEYSRPAVVHILIDEPLVRPTVSAWQNPANHFDVNGDGHASPLDLALVEDVLAREGNHRLPDPTPGEAPPPYLDVNGDFHLSSADVSALEDQFGDTLVGIRLSAADEHGSPLEQIDVGDTFYLEVYAADLREQPQGIFAAFSDITFDSTLASVVGEPEFADAFPVARAANTAEPGEIDEAGAARNAAAADTPAETFVYRIQMRSTAAGHLIIESNPAENLPPHDILLLGRNTAVPTSRVRYDSTNLTIGEPIEGQPRAGDDRYTVTEDTQLAVSVDDGVLANDTDPNGGALTAVLVERPANGSVDLNDDGSFTYTPRADFSGADRFSYRAAAGAISSTLAVVTIDVQPTDDGPPIAATDSYSFVPGQTLQVAASHGVLANDEDPDQQPLFAELVAGPIHGELQLRSDGGFTYTSVADTTEDDSFTYRASDGVQVSEVVTVNLQPSDSTDSIVRFDVVAVNENGDAIEEVMVGDAFTLQVLVEDIRNPPMGVFAAYTDVEFDAGLVSVAGDISYGDAYPNGKSGDTSKEGVIDEAGAFASSFTPLGGGPFLVFSVPFTATAVGAVTFAANPADELPSHDVAVYGLNEAVGGGQIDFGDTTILNVPAIRLAFRSAALRVVAAPLVADDAFKVLSDSPAQPLDVLANDPGSGLSLHEVGGVSSGGSADVSTGEVTYAPPPGFIGVDEFTYSASEKGGALQTATVTVTVVSRFQNQTNRFDTDNDGELAPLDALFGINRLNERGPRKLLDRDLRIGGRVRYLDINGDGFHSSNDILAVVNRLNQEAAAEGESIVVTAAADKPQISSQRPDRKLVSNEIEELQVGVVQRPIVPNTPAQADVRNRVFIEQENDSQELGFPDELATAVDELAADISQLDR